MNNIEAIVLGLVQGLTEFIPVSSTGHLILARSFLGISEGGLAFDAVLQLATVLAVIVYFLKEVPVLLRDRKLVLAIILGTLPAIVFGLLLESKMDTLFRSTHLVALSLLGGAALMYFADKKPGYISEVNPKKGLIIGFFQSLAIIPGFSRSGATISGGLLNGLTRESATRFSFLLSVPILLGTGLKKLMELQSSGELSTLGTPLLVGSIVAFVSGLWAVNFLMNYLKNHKLTPFIWYRVVVAILIIIFI